MMRLYRSQRDKKIFGLCGGLAEAFHIDATILRLIVAIGVVFSGGTVLLLYVVASLVIPKEPDPYAAAPNPHYCGPRHSPPSPPQHRQSPPPPPPVRTEPGVESNIDEMMKDIEKKALLKEIEELKARIAKLEKGE